MTQINISVTSASFWAFANSIGTRGLSFFFFVLLSRELAPSDLGVMALALSLTFIVDALCDAGLSEAVVRQPNREDRFLRAVTTMQGGIGLAFVFILTMISPLLSRVFHESLLICLLPAVAAASFFNALSLCPLAILKREMRFKEIAVRNFIATLTGGLIGVLMAHSGYGVWSLVAMHVANTFTGAIVSCVVARWLPYPTLDLAPLKAVSSFALNMTGTRVLESSLSRADQLIVGGVFGTASLGLYALAVKLYEVLISVVCGPFSDVFFTRLARTSGDRMQFSSDLMRFLHFSALVGPLAFIFAALFSTTFLAEMFGQQWIDAKPFIWLVLGFGALQSLAYVHNVAFVALGLAHIRFKLVLFSMTLWAITIGLFFQHGSLMAAVAWACRVSIVVPVQIFFLHRELKFSMFEYWNAVRAGVWAVISVVVCYWSAHILVGDESKNFLLWLVILSIICAIAAAVLWFLSPFARLKCQEVFRGLGLNKAKP